MRSLSDDTTFDMKMAQAAKLRSIGAGWERRAALNVRVYRVDHAVAELRAFIRNILND
jgi:phosphoglycolate phosphatase-like HAD superfamily hydrolase